MATVVGEATGPVNKTKVMLLEALQSAVKKAPPPPPNQDVQSFRLVSVEIEHGGFLLRTKTRVTLDLRFGSSPKGQSRKGA